MAVEPEPRRREPRNPVQQRIYVGVVGLAAVFLLTLFAAAMLALLGQDTRGSGTPLPSAAATHRFAGEDSPREPLAELGVAPGNAPKVPANSQAPAAAAPDRTQALPHR